MGRDPLSAIDLLVLWHRCEEWGALACLGMPKECPSTQGYRASRQYDDVNGAQELDERSMLARAVGHVVDGMDEPYRTALYVLARNHASGVTVWRSPRLPADRDECAEVVAEALAIFSERV